MSHPIDRAQEFVSGTPGTGAVTLNGAAAANMQTFANAAIGLGLPLVVGDTVSVLAMDTGNAWEIWEATVTGLAPTVLSAPDPTQVGFQSSTGSALSLTSSAIISVVDSARVLAPLPGLAGNLGGI